MKELESQEVGLSSEEPPFSDYISGKTPFDLKSGQTPLKDGYSKVFITALSALQSIQHDLLKRSVTDPIRQDGTLRAWRKNLVSSDVNLTET